MQKSTKKIAAITMARNDNFFLEKWIKYYGNQIGEENLYIFLDGEEQQIPINSGKANITKLKHKTLSRAAGDKYRIGLINQTAKRLFQTEKYDLVIGTDCDEFLVVDPNLNITLKEYLSKTEIKNSISALGIDVGQNSNLERELNNEKSILAQRKYGLLSPRYTKAIVLSKPLTWGSGFHRVKGHNFHIDSQLYLFHMGYCDLKMLEMKSDKSRIKEDWSNHLKRRAETIYLATNRCAKNGDKYIPIARKIQKLIRPLYALNKPSMAGWKLIIEIPERFEKIDI